MIPVGEHGSTACFQKRTFNLELHHTLTLQVLLEAFKANVAQSGQE